MNALVPSHNAVHGRNSHDERKQGATHPEPSGTTVDTNEMPWAPCGYQHGHCHGKHEYNKVLKHDGQTYTVECGATDKPYCHQAYGP